VTDVTMYAAAVEPVAEDAVDEQLVRQLGQRARAEGLQLTGEGGLLQRLTKMVVESALDGEMEDHLGYAKHELAGRDGGNSRNGTRAMEVLTEAGPVQIAVPRDRDGSFTPQLVKKRQRRLSGLDDLVISLSAKSHNVSLVSLTSVDDVRRRVQQDTQRPGRKHEHQGPAVAPDVLRVQVPRPP